MTNFDEKNYEINDREYEEMVLAEEELLKESVKDEEEAPVEEKPLTSEEIAEGFMAFENDAQEADDDSTFITGLTDRLRRLGRDDLICVERIVEQLLDNMDGKDKLYHEAMALGEKIDKAEKFLRRRNINGVRVVEEMHLTEAAVFLLQEQIEVMKKYYNILVSRYSIFDVRNPVDEAVSAEDKEPEGNA